MKKLTVEEFNACKSRPNRNSWKAEKIKLIAKIGTEKVSAKELYEIIVFKPSIKLGKNSYISKTTEKHLYFVQRFKTDVTGQFTIILRFNYVKQ